MRVLLALPPRLSPPDSFEMNALFLGSTEYPESMTGLLARNKGRFITKQADFMSKAWLGTPHPKNTGWIQNLLNYYGELRGAGTQC